MIYCYLNEETSYLFFYPQEMKGFTLIKAVPTREEAMIALQDYTTKMGWGDYEEHNKKALSRDRMQE